MDQRAPPSVVRTMVPARPTIQQMVVDGAAPEVRSVRTPLAWRDQEAPPLPEKSITPARPARQRTVAPGATIKRGELADASSIAVERNSETCSEGAGSGAAWVASSVALVSGFNFFAATAGAGAVLEMRRPEFDRIAARNLLLILNLIGNDLALQFCLLFGLSNSGDLGVCIRLVLCHRRSQGRIAQRLLAQVAFLLLSRLHRGDAYHG